MFDLNSIQEVNTAKVELVHPLTKAPLGASITLAGPEHPQRKKLIFDRQRKLRASFAKKGRIDFSDPTEDEEDEIDLLAACTLGWDGIAENGKAVEFSKAAATDLYGKPELSWLRAQVREALDNRENFISESGSN